MLVNMSDSKITYTIAVRILNASSSTMELVEQTCWKYAPPCYWTKSQDDLVLNMGESGTSGMLRYIFSDGDVLKIAVGVHNYKRWCDVDTTSGEEKVLTEVHPMYYSGGEKDEKLWAQADRAEARTAKGKKVELWYDVKEGEQLRCFVKIE